MSGTGDTELSGDMLQKIQAQLAEERARAERAEEQVRKLNAQLAAERGRIEQAESQAKKVNAQLSTARDRAARLETALILEQDKSRKLDSAYKRRDNDAWAQGHTIETLKLELRAIATTAANLQAQLLMAQQTRSATPTMTLDEPHVPIDLSPEAQERNAALEAALMDLEERLELAVTLVLDELNGRKAAEARIRELERMLASFRVQLQQGSRGGKLLDW